MKKFKTKRHVKKNIIILIGFIIFLFIFIWISFQRLNHSHKKLIQYMLNNTSFYEDKKLLTFKLDYLLNNYYFYEEKKESKNNIPQIYLYNTHEKEKYIDNKSVYDASLLLQNNLKRLGINTLVEDKKVSDYLHTGMKNYDISREFIKKIKKEYPDVCYYIDIHRDSVKNTKITINNKDYAQIMFVLGLDNPNYQSNKDILVKMNDYLNNNYPGISKGIYEKSGSSVNGIYNQDLDKHVLLIEIGGIENNTLEVNNSTEIIALMLYHMLGDNE